MTDMIFVTPDDQSNFVTTFGPVGLAGLHQNIKDTLSGLGEVPQHIPLPNTALVGEIPETTKTKEFFGQIYDTEVLQMLGVLLMRANLLDQNLIELDSAVTGMTLEHAHARYHSTTNMKARLDILRASISISKFSEFTRSGAIDALDNAKGVTDRRNALVHSHWSFRNGKHRATVSRPNTSKPDREITVTAKTVLALAEDYYTVTLHLTGVTQSILRMAAEITASTPAEGDPSS